MLAKVRPKRRHGLFDRLTRFWSPHRAVRVQPINDCIRRRDGIRMDLCWCTGKGATVLPSHHFDATVIADHQHLVAADLKISSARGDERCRIGRGVFRLGLSTSNSAPAPSKVARDKANMRGTQ